MYKVLGIHFRNWLWLYSPLALFIRIKIYPKSVTKEAFFDIHNGKSIIYVLPRMSILDTLVLNKALKNFGQKKIVTEAKPKRFRYCALLAIKSGSILFSNFHKDHFLSDFIKLLKNDPRAKNDKFIFVPVSIFWSRAPERNEKGFILRSLFPDDGTGNFLQKIFMLILHRGEVNISFGKYFQSPNLEALTSNEIENNSNIDNEVDIARKMRRLFNIEFAKERTAAFGPTLYDNDKICQWILSTSSTKKFIANSDNPIKTEQQIVKYIYEIGANYNYVTIRALEKMFDFVWNKIFEGVRVRNFEYIERIAKDGQILWMPCHRSHFDYLLLSYVLFKKGFVVPHIAAGINLNFWPVGSILRRGGAFFIRRSFSGNKVYAHTFSEYVNFLLQNSFPVEFFQEGGRSRIGKLLVPKIGMLNICIQSVIQRKAENTYIVPVYFGYDKVMEDDSYAKELKGAKKQKENAFQFLNGIRKVFSNYGSVDVSFGDPIRIGTIWNDYFTNLRKEMPNISSQNEILPNDLKNIPDNIDTRDPQIQGLIKNIAVHVNQKINSAATASGTAILASCLLANSNQKIAFEDLQFQSVLINYLINELGKNLNWKLSTSIETENIFEYIKFYLNQFNPSQEDLVLTQSQTNLASIHNFSEQLFSMGERWKLIFKEYETEGNIYFLKNEDKEMNLWWYRGTIFHILTPFGLISQAINLENKQNFSFEYFQFIINSFRKIWQDELFWDQSTSSETITKSCLNIFTQIGLLLPNADFSEFYLQKDNPKNTEIVEFLAKTIQPECELYGIMLSTAIELVKSKGVFSRDELIQKAITTHSAAYLRTIAYQPPIFSKVFSQRAFESLYKAGMFTPRENQKLSLNPTVISGLTHFLNVSLWSNYVTS